MPSITASRNAAAFQKYFTHCFMRDDKKLYFGTDGDASVEYDEDGTDQVRCAGTNAWKFDLPIAVGSNTETLATNKTLVATDLTLQLLKDDGSEDRTIILPAEASSDGLIFIIVNTGTSNDLIVTDDASATIVTIQENSKSAMLVCDGTSWKTITSA